MEEGEREGKGRRVPCPADPNHTVLEKQLDAHLKVGGIPSDDVRDVVCGGFLHTESWKQGSHEGSSVLD